MENEINTLRAKRDKYEVGSEQYKMYQSIINELDGVKLYKAEDAICESCQ